MSNEWNIHQCIATPKRLRARGSITTWGYPHNIHWCNLTFGKSPTNWTNCPTTPTLPLKGAGCMSIGNLPPLVTRAKFSCKFKLSKTTAFQGILFLNRYRFNSNLEPLRTLNVASSTFNIHLPLNLILTYNTLPCFSFLSNKPPKPRAFWVTLK